MKYAAKLWEDPASCQVCVRIDQSKPRRAVEVVVSEEMMERCVISEGETAYRFGLYADDAAGGYRSGKWVRVLRGGAMEPVDTVTIVHDALEYLLAGAKRVDLEGKDDIQKAMAVGVVKYLEGVLAGGWPLPVPGEENP